MFGKSNYNKARELQNSGEYAEAIKKYSKALGSGDLNETEIYNSYLLIGRCCINLNEFDRALANLKAALDWNSEFYGTYYEFGRVYYEKGEYKLALQYFNKAIERESDDVLSWELKGWTLEELLRFDEAENALRNALNYALVSKPDEVNEIKERIEQLGAKKHYNKGEMLYDAEDYEKALKEFDLILSFPVISKHILYQAHLEKGKCLYGLKKYDSAIFEFKKSAELEPENYFTYYVTGLCQRQRGKLEKAVNLFDKAILLAEEINEIIVNCWYYKGLCLQDLEQYVTAQCVLETAAKHAKDLKSDSLFEINEALNSLEYNKTLAPLMKFLKEKNYPDALLGVDKLKPVTASQAQLQNILRGGIYFGLERYGDALSYLKPLVGDTTLNSELTFIAYSWTGETYFKLKHYETALSYLDRGIAEGGNEDGETWAYKGECHMELKQYEKAVDAFRNAVKYLTEGDDYDVPSIEARLKLANQKLDEAKAKTIPSHITIQGNNNPINLGGILATDEAIITRSSVKKEPVEEAACFCPKCGAKVGADDLFCRKCGGKLQ